MSAVTTIRPGSAGPTFGRLIASEWIKLFSLRATWWLYGATVVLFVGIAALASTSAGAWPDSTVNPASPVNAGRTGAASTPDGILTAQVDNTIVQWGTAVLLFAALVVSVLGAIGIAGEYGTGMIKSTFAAAPRRSDALFAKFLVSLLASLAVGAIGTLLATALSSLVLSGRGWPIELGDSYLWRAIGGTIGYVGFAGAFGTLIGAIIRAQAGAIPAAIGILLVLPTIVSLLTVILGWDWLRNVGQFLPSTLGGAFADYPLSEALQASAIPDSGFQTSGPGSPWLTITDPAASGGTGGKQVSVGDALAGLLLVAWLVIGWVVAQIVTKRRDV